MQSISTGATSFGTWMIQDLGIPAFLIALAISLIISMYSKRIEPFGLVVLAGCLYFAIPQIGTGLRSWFGGA